MDVFPLKTGDLAILVLEPQPVMKDAAHPTVKANRRVENRGTDSFEMSCETSFIDPPFASMESPLLACSTLYVQGRTKTEHRRRRVRREGCGSRRTLSHSTRTRHTERECACPTGGRGCGQSTTLGRHSSETRTGCANERPSGSVRGALAKLGRLVSLPRSPTARVEATLRLPTLDQK
jgi:hypothetical protein